MHSSGRGLGHASRETWVLEQRPWPESRSRQWEVALGRTDSLPSGTCWGGPLNTGPGAQVLGAWVRDNNDIHSVTETEISQNDIFTTCDALQYFLFYSISLFKNSFQPGPRSSVGWSIILLHRGCGFNPQSGHIQEATYECINKRNNKSMSLSLSLSSPHQYFFKIALMRDISQGLRNMRQVTFQVLPTSEVWR